MAKKEKKTGKELERRVAQAYRDMGAWKVEHDVEMVADVADRLCVLVAGRIVAEGPPSTVLGDLATASKTTAQRPDLGEPGSQAGQEG